MKRKTVDRIADFPDPSDTRPAYLKPPFQGRYRVRVYEGDGDLPVVIATDATPGSADPTWLDNYAPQLAALVAREDVPSRDGLYWITPYPSSDEETKGDVYERTRFHLVGNGVAYDQRIRPGVPPPLEPQALLCSKADVEALIGDTLD